MSLGIRYIAAKLMHMWAFEVRRILGLQINNEIAE